MFSSFSHICYFKAVYSCIRQVFLQYSCRERLHSCEAVRSVPASPEEFENEGFTLKTRQMFSVHTTPEEFKNAATTGHFGCVFEENSVREIT